MMRTAVGQVERGGVPSVAGGGRAACVVIDLTQRRGFSDAREVAGPGVRPAARPGPLVLTRRGVLVVRLVAAIAAAVVLASAVLMTSGGARADDVRRAPVGTERVVMPGDTLWRIAREEAPAADPREVMRQLAEVNDLAAGGELVVGQRLFVPAGLGR